MRVPGYLRYVDDLLFFADEKALLWERKARIEARLADSRLTLHAGVEPKPTSEGVPFLGFVVLSGAAAAQAAQRDPLPAALEDDGARLPGRGVIARGAPGEHRRLGEPPASRQYRGLAKGDIQRGLRRPLAAGLTASCVTA
ncbi:MAG: hypothetical protein ACRDF6_12745 [bacterium]